MISNVGALADKRKREVLRKSRVKIGHVGWNKAMLRMGIFDNEIYAVLGAQLERALAELPAALRRGDFLLPHLCLSCHPMGPSVCNAGR